MTNDFRMLGRTRQLSHRNQIKKTATTHGGSSRDAVYEYRRCVATMNYPGASERIELTVAHVEPIEGVGLRLIGLANDQQEIELVVDSPHGAAVMIDCLLEAFPSLFSDLEASGIPSDKLVGGVAQLVGTYDKVFEKGQDIINRIVYTKPGSLKQDAACSALYAYAKESPEVTALMAIAVAKTMSDLREHETKHWQ
jgi:hypothetical protein